jgi:lipopolysaccharide/colanic/teichoic acid biosynthesis glycosyltransferase
MSPELESAAATLSHFETARAAVPRSCAADWPSLEPRGFYARRGRRLLDLLLLVLAIVPVSALALLVALANLAYFRDPRKILFVQQRIGQRGRRFLIYKFRTMRAPRFSAHESWVHGYDRERVTLLGVFLRSTHLDELPQILNILKGEMTFIGPRPEMVEIEAWASEHIEGFSKRLVLKPGITGYAQITQGYTGHSIEAYSTKLDLNERYRAGYSLALDLEILARTVAWIARGRGWTWKLHDVAWNLRATALRPRNARLRRQIGEKAARAGRKYAESSR